MQDSKPLINIANISVSYGTTPALQDVTLTVYEHDFLGVIGPNGGGKTTLVKAILGLVPLQSGTITYYDTNGQHTAKLNIGYLPQYSSFDFRFPITVSEVVSAGLLSGKSIFYHPSRTQRQQVDQILSLMEISELADRSIGELSGGQRQRVLMARALIGQPRLLILDEPSTYIDTDSQEQLYRLLHTISEKCAILLVSHDIGAVFQAVRNIACVNRTLHYHPASEPAAHWFEHEMGCPLELVAHGQLPHRVLSAH